MTDKKHDVLLGAAIAALVLIPLPVMAADVAGEISTAATHATLAAQATALDGVHTHLHHTLNCLVGPGGSGFDAKQINPCAGSGAGAIPDESDAAKKKALEGAADTTRAGIAAADMATATKAANQVASELKAVK
ncbi:MAG TPA: hypothetical protein VNB30_13385 [Rhizomicrobium sp.]|jgi:hypothetical protein|nr:hypothetical protein [Rhizomicrobium sp.]